MRRVCSWILVSAALAAGCGGKSPTSPSATGATISGTILAPGGSSSSVSGAGGGPGLVVSVTGTNVSAQVDVFSRFKLHDVPAGDAELTFTGPAFSATLGLPAVQTSETISIVVSLGSSSVVLESQTRVTGTQEQLEGRVEALPPETLPLRLVVAGRMVVTDATTQFLFHGASAAFADLEVGQRVHVKGQTSGGALLAALIDIQNTNTEIQVPINGIVTDFSGGAANFQFRIDGRLIRGDATTEFFGNSAFSELANGVRAEVKGDQRNGYVYAVRIHINVSDDDDGNDESSSIEGVLTSIGGAVPMLTLVVAGTTVHTSASTEVQRRGDVQGLSVLQLGMTLHVVGARQPDSSINARKVQIKDDAAGALFEIEGSMGGVHGTCPVLSFGVNGYDFVTDGATVFTPACSQFKSGNKIRVKGVVQASGTIKATSVQKQ